jgi:hypothetical protein
MIPTTNLATDYRGSGASLFSTFGMVVHFKDELEGKSAAKRDAIIKGRLEIDVPSSGRPVKEDGLQLHPNPDYEDGPIRRRESTTCSKRPC